MFSPKLTQYAGCLEAIIVPSITILVAGFYKKSEQPPRNAIVFAAISSVINGFLSWVVGHIPASAPLAIWQYLYIIIGILHNVVFDHLLMVARVYLNAVVHNSLLLYARLPNECFLPYRTGEVLCGTTSC